MKFALTTAAALAAFAMPAVAQETTVWNLDPSHSQIVFEYNHLGFSTTTGMFSGFEGVINLDEAEPQNSSVEVSFPVRTMLTGWEERFTHFMSDDFFGAAEGDDQMVTFTSTSVELEDEDEAKITGDLTLNGITKQIVLEAELNQRGDHPASGKPTMGFDAETTIKRSEFDLGMFVPATSDEVEINISVEAIKAE
ncbi:YceI family protein [Paracoccus tegillarcae]|uniref:Lipid/polyisoprenoid-binding YceI-like domain-containing protein n=1 Tax=Paracoccus tegillarcae TaxID=1529068 RepID=A0A2K9EB91_9RHOB|nr:YceI family protein [Paracoccus tegillarcae]AUH32173.1 hypothetical protein CUV01_01045 [Paracoccus tegillarcae]